MARRKKVEESSGGSAPWLTTYSDLVTLLLCFFILLFSMAIVDKQKFEKVALSMRAAFSGAGAEAFDRKSGETMLSLTPYENGEDILNEPDEGTEDEGDETGKGTDETGEPGDQGGEAGSDDDEGLTGDKNGETGARDEQGNTGDEDDNSSVGGKAAVGEDPGEGSISAFKVDIQGLIDKLGLNENIKIIDEGTLIILRMDSVLLFDTGNADLKASAKPVIKKIGTVLKTVDTEIQVQGHADDRPINTREFPSNWELSTKRATNVVKFLVDECDIKADNLTATGNAEFKPIVPNDSEYNRQKNRRIDIAILK